MPDKCNLVGDLSYLVDFLLGGPESEKKDIGSEEGGGVGD